MKKTKRVVPHNAEPGLNSLRKKGYTIRDCFQIETRPDGKDVYLVKYEKST